MFAFSSASIVAFVAVGAVGHVNNGFPARAELPGIFANYQVDNKALQDQSWNPLRRLSKSEKYGVDKNGFDQTLWFADGDERWNVLIVGNSHSKDLFNALISSEEVSKDFEIARYGIQVSFLDDFGSKFYRSPNYIAADIVLLATRYRYKGCETCGGGNADDLAVLDEVIARLERDNKLPVIVGNTPEFPNFRSRNLADTVLLRLAEEHTAAPRLSDLTDRVNRLYFARKGDAERDVEKVNRDLERIARANRVPFLDREDFICDQGRGQCFAVSEDLTKLIYDYGHISLDGAKYFGRRIDETDWFEPVFAKWRSSAPE